MTLKPLLRSAVTERFQAALADFTREGRPNEAIRYAPMLPPVKVERVLAQLLEQHPELEVERVELDASSGCEYFRGDLRVHTPAEVRSIRFEWNCKWKAEQQGWRDYFGFPDQTRAAREFGHRCFRIWEPESVEVLQADRV